MHPLHSSLLFFFRKHFSSFVWLLSVDLIPKRAHAALEVLKLQNVAFRRGLFGRAPSRFTSDNQMTRAVAYRLQLSSPHSHALPPLRSAGQTRLN